MLDTVLDFRRWARDFLHRNRVAGTRTIIPGDIAGISHNGQECEASSVGWEKDNMHLTASG